MLKEPQIYCLVTPIQQKTLVFNFLVNFIDLWKQPSFWLNWEANSECTTKFYRRAPNHEKG